MEDAYLRNIDSLDCELYCGYLGSESWEGSDEGMFMLWDELYLPDFLFSIYNYLYTFSLIKFYRAS